MPQQHVHHTRLAGACCPRYGSACAGTPMHVSAPGQQPLCHAGVACQRSAVEGPGRPLGVAVGISAPV